MYLKLGTEQGVNTNVKIAILHQNLILLLYNTFYNLLRRL